jgi:hypothetical protein
MAGAQADVVLERVRRDVDSGIASGEVRSIPTLFIDGVVHPGKLRRGHLAQDAGPMSAIAGVCVLVTV